MRHAIVPPYLLSRIAALDPERYPSAAPAAQRALLVDDRHRVSRLELTTTANRLDAAHGTHPERTIYDAHSTEALPGDRVRGEGDAATGDAATDEAYDALGATYRLYSEVYERNSIDGKGLPLDASVHYGRLYDNAFWNGERMVFGDGDGEIFTRFTVSTSVIGHELAHGVTQYTANLAYQGQSGALNESVSDVFGALVEQHAAGQTADRASWLIGEGLFTDRVKGVALRSMKAPGTAYDDTELGRDPQPATMQDYAQTSDDNGGVHVNSGIPNHAFYLAATAIGGHAWDGAGRVWYDALTRRVKASYDFAAFAAATIASAATVFGATSSQAAAVTSAWAEVGVVPRA